MTSRNDITGDELKSKTNNDKYRDGWERIFGKKDQPMPDEKKEADIGQSVESTGLNPAE